MNKSLNHSMSYSGLYDLSEELCQLKGSTLSEIICEKNDRYFLAFFAKSFGRRWLVLDLTPSQPLILSTNSAVPHKQIKTTPVLNFLRAHFKGLRLETLAIAEKPNRTLKLTFSYDGSPHEILFKCFPHGQALGLFAEDKHVIFPLGAQFEEGVSFVEPEVKNSWQLNEELASAVGIGTENEEPASQLKSPKLAKMEKSFKAMKEKKEGVMLATKEKIAQLEKEAQAAEGSQLNAIHTEIKKLKRRMLEYGEKQNQLERRIKFFKELPEEQQAFSNSGFKGTKIQVHPQWQFWVGRKAEQNDELVRLAEPHELWFHLRDAPSAHGVLRGPKKLEPTPQIIEYCCQILAVLSQKKSSPFREGEKIDFIVTPRKFIKKKKGSPPGTVIVERETVRRIAYKNVDFNVL